MPRGRPKGPGQPGDKPRGRMSAYAFFVQICRQEHKVSHPDENVEFAKFSKQCAERWKTMDVSDKTRFNSLAEKDKIRYDTQMQDYVPPPGFGKRGRRVKKMKDPNKPKRALSAFFYYANEARSSVREINPDFSVGEVAKELGRRWNELSDAQKNPHERSAELDRARYDKDMKIYRAGGIPDKSANGHAMPVDQDDLEEDEDEL